MEHLDGRIFKDVKLPSLSPGERQAVYAEVVRVLAAIHSVDVAAAGLKDFGKLEDYCARQVRALGV
jgi:aminoglycoside phosphotransferase (APT) family kinase protein